jgi:pullulanase
MSEAPSVAAPKIVEPKMLYAYWTNWKMGVIVLQKDWFGSQKMPPLYLNPGERPFSFLKRAPAYDFGLIAGYYGEEEDIIFLIKCSDHMNIDWLDQDFYVAGDFNDWEKATGKAEWKMSPQRVGDELCFSLRVAKELCVEDKPVRFKFASSKGQWLSIPSHAPNAVQDSHNNYNYELHPTRTGYHRLYFQVPNKTESLGLDEVVWPHPHRLEACKVRCGKLFLSLQTDKPLGAIVEGDKTLFRLFAPRADRVVLSYFHPSAPQDLCTLDLSLRDDCYWEGECSQNLHGFHYYYQVHGANKDALSHFDENFKVLDPYAMLTVGREGPGIIVDKAKMHPPISIDFEPPAWEDLVILEGHVRDLIAKAPIPLSPEERLGFKGLERFLKSEGSYLTSLGVNALELQPIQAFDNVAKEDYHWGYMPINYFAPAPAYVKDNTSPEQMYELQSLVNTCHEQGLAVIVDVVYNHYGEPNHLLYLDKYHYFEVNEEGAFSNFSGCGNDLRGYAPMTKRLIIDSLLHWIECYKVDGFRFDLAELLGTRLLKDIEATLKALYPKIILIAEPWSFKGHIGYELRSTGFASWNDGYRDFLHKYLMGNGDSKGFEYYIQGSLAHLARFPSQSVNYAASHDDYAWIDRITENPKHNAHNPTLNDRGRTHLMLAFIMASIGIPLLAQGMDSLHSKLGINNTYKRGELNALDYERAAQYPATHAYFKAWIGFRLSPLGRLLRLKHRPAEGYFQFFKSPHSSAMGVLYNADSHLGHERLLFAINPHLWDSVIPLSSLQAKDFKQIGDHERLEPEGLEGATFSWDEASNLHLPPLSCGLWALR